MTTKIETIRALNDELRQNLTVGTAFITAGVAALSAARYFLASGIWCAQKLRGSGAIYNMHHYHWFCPD